MVPLTRHARYRRWERQEIGRREAARERDVREAREVGEHRERDRIKIESRHKAKYDATPALADEREDG